MATRRQTKRAGARAKAAAPDEVVERVPDGVASGVADAAPPQAAAPAVTSIGGVLSIRTAGRLAEDLRLALQSGAVRVDASGVEQVDTAGMQLLVATVATADTLGVPFEWIGVSAALRDAARHLGLGDTLRLLATG